MNRINTNPLDVIKKYGVQTLSPLVVDVQISSGCNIVDVITQKKFIDLSTNDGRIPLGYNHPKLIDKEFNEKICHIATNKSGIGAYMTVELSEFIEKFSNLFLPNNLMKFKLFSDESLAYQEAVALSLLWKKRFAENKGSWGTKNYNLITFLSGSRENKIGCSISKAIKKSSLPIHTCIIDSTVSFPYPGTYGPGMLPAKPDEILGNFNKFLSENSHYISGCLIEPVLTSAGDIFISKGFLKELRSSCDKYDVLLILDEINCGFCASGSMWYFERENINPDILIFGGRSQVTGIAVSNKVEDILVKQVYQPYERGASPLDIARAVAILDIIESDKLEINVKKIGRYFLDALKDLASLYSLIENPRGEGVILAFDLQSTELRDIFIRETYNHGVLVLKGGKNSIRLRPPFIITETEIDEVITIFHTILRKLSSIKEKKNDN